MSSLPDAAVISQLPLTVVGGGERFTINAHLSAIRGGVAADMWCVSHGQPDDAPHASRMEQPYQRLLNHGGTVAVVETVPLRELLRRQADYRIVHVHQYLRSATTLDILAAASPWQRTVLTSHGCEPIADLFVKTFEGHPGVEILEVSRYAAARASARGLTASHVSAAIWESAIRERPTRGRRPGPLGAVAVGRLLPHKAFDVAIEAVAGMPAEVSLTVIGPSSGDAEYEAWLKKLAARAPSVELTGYVTDDVRETLLAGADVLVANSSHDDYRGSRVEQPELFGLVILEGLAGGLLPIASDIPSFREIAEEVGLVEWLYPERNVAALQERLAAAAALSPGERQAIVAAATERMRRAFLWDDYWPRVDGQGAAVWPRVVADTARDRAA
jgi:glycosyltransferase involved in cell wall biosynthesis